MSYAQTQRYVQTQRPETMPSFLDICREGRLYRYELLAANLREQQHSVRGSVAEHTHAVYHVVLYVAGNGWVSINGQRYPVKQGVLAVVPPSCPHTFTSPEGHVVYHAVTFALTDREQCLDLSVDSLLAHYSGQSVRLPALMTLDAASFGLLRQRIEELVGGLQRSPVDWLGHQQRMVSIMALLSTLGQVQAPAAGLADRAQAVLESRYADSSLTLQSLAHELHTAPEHLCRQFRRHTGLSPIQYRNQLRVQAAGALLRNTNLPCKAIADQLGYADLYTFSKAYRRAAGHSPSRERAKSV